MAGPYTGPRVKGANPQTLQGKVMAGYQGWFTAEGDGEEKGFWHYGRGAGFRPGECGIDLWPDVSELDSDEKYPTAFRHADGRTAFVFSSHNHKTIDRHFGWMEKYGIDGVFLQRFAVETVAPASVAHCNKVLADCRSAANQHGRVYAVMYDLTGLKAGETGRVMEDWKMLVNQMRIGRDPGDGAYLCHDGKPVVALWGVGFKNVACSLDECRRLVEFFKTDPTCGNNTVVLGVPWGWRTLDRDSIPDPALLDVLLKADVISPWTVGRYDSPAAAARNGAGRETDDILWCRDHRRSYLPVVFPGFSWHNLNPRQPANQIPRLKGEFLWEQCAAAKKAGAGMMYVAMFDEINEGTAIFKCTNDPPVGDSPFVTLEGLPADQYLWLAGQAGRLIRGELAPSGAMPQRE